MKLALASSLLLLLMSASGSLARSDCAVPDMDDFLINNTYKILTTNQGVPIADDDNSLRAGTRGPTLLEDFIMREKITHFDHERIPERVVHARGSAAHGIFEAYEDNGMSQYTTAKVLTDSKYKTPVYVRFSTVAGSRGSGDTPRDVRGFAVKFYTQEGIWDLVGNNIPVFFIQDAIKFPDVIHAVKPEPRTEIPQAASAHDTFWDFVGLQTETAHMIMWVMSDRALPRSYANMEGFGIHTFRLINAQGQSHYVKYHWKPLLAVDSLLFDEAQKINGKDPDFNRRQLYDWIDSGDFYPQYELGVQIFTDEDANGFDFDILDATKLIPEELIPVQRVGRLTLNRNPDNFFAETEQVAYCASHIVPGMDFTNDPLLQGRLFSYLDTQITRLGGPNFHEIPINRPRQCPFSANNQRDGAHRYRIDSDEAAYSHNSINAGSGNWPRPLAPEEGGFASYPERTDGVKRRIRSKSFDDHFSQATLFFNSMSSVEQEHIISAISFELSKVTRENIRRRVVENMLANINSRLARKVAANIGLKFDAGKDQPEGAVKSAGLQSSPTLSQLDPANRRPDKTDLTTRKINLLAANDADAALVDQVKNALKAAGAKVMVASGRLGYIGGKDSGKVVKIDQLIVGSPSVLFDAVVVVGDGLAENGEALHIVAEAYKHAKPIAAFGAGSWKVLAAAGLEPKNVGSTDGVYVNNNENTSNQGTIEAFVEAVSQHRVWTRKHLDRISA